MTARAKKKPTPCSVRDPDHLQVVGLTEQQRTALDQLVASGMFGGSRAAVLSKLVGDALLREAKWWKTRGERAAIFDWKVAQPIGTVRR